MRVRGKRMKMRDEVRDDARCELRPGAQSLWTGHWALCSLIFKKQENVIYDTGAWTLVLSRLLSLPTL